MISTTTLLAAYGTAEATSLANLNGLAEGFSARLNQPVIACPLDEDERPLLNAISQALRGGAVRLLILPLFLSPAEYKSNAIAEAVTFASRRFPFLQFHLGPSIAWHAWLQVMNNLDLPGLQNPAELGLILAAQNDVPEVNSDLAKLARLIYEANEFGWVEPVYVGENGRPSLPAMLNRMEQLGAKQKIVIPWVLFTGTAVAQINEIVAADQGSVVTPHLSAQPALLDLLATQYEMALSDRSLLPISWEEVERQLSAELNSHDKVKPVTLAADEDEYQQLNAKINAILPPRYQDNLEAVSSTPMSAAALVYDNDGKVAWDGIFGFDDSDSPFCELALAGGPSHRGELLEAVTSEECAEEIAKYMAVVAEIERGIQTITGLTTVKSSSPGWVGVQCHSDEMAIWLVRAIIVENVMVRRQGDVLYLPAGPSFTLKNQIKSVVTVTAKTWHYWNEHVLYKGSLSTTKM